MDDIAKKNFLISNLISTSHDSTDDYSKKFFLKERKGFSDQIGEISQVLESEMVEMNKILRQEARGDLEMKAVQRLFQSDETNENSIFITIGRRRMFTNQKRNILKRIMLSKRSRRRFTPRLLQQFKPPRKTESEQMDKYQDVFDLFRKYPMRRVSSGSLFLQNGEYYTSKSLEDCNFHERTMEWLLLIMAAHPQVQKKIFKEILTAAELKEELEPQTLPLTTASIFETLRWRGIFPFSGIYKTPRDAVWSNYFIPRGSYVVTNIWSIFQKPNYWGENTLHFNPARFLLKNREQSKFLSSFIKNKLRYIQRQPEFQKLFSKIVAIVRNFVITLAEKEVFKMDGQYELCLIPQKQRLLLIRR